MSRAGDTPSQQNALFCPRCKRSVKLIEWEPVFRRVLQADTGVPGRVLRHVSCEVMVYFLLE